LSGDAYDRGMEVRREVLGDEHVDAAIERTTEFTAEFQSHVKPVAERGRCARCRGR
jgi:4-carboxymuconolactone decarboxylase